MSQSEMSQEKPFANAALITAAPELLEALRVIAANASSVQLDPQWAVQVARAAIAKATGSAAC